MFSADLRKAFAYTTAVDGSEDNLIDSSAQHFWEGLDMPDE